MRRLAVALGLGVLMLAGCSDDAPNADAESAESSEPSSSIDEAVARERYLTVCERTAAPADVASCAELVDEAIDAAVDGGCEATALEAYFEHGVAWQFESLPGADFFETCPTPLSTALLPVAPDGFDASEPGEGGSASMTTDDLAAVFADVEGTRSFLTDAGHEVSHSVAWRRDPSDSITVRLDRFAEVAGAEAFSAPDPDAATVPSTVIGVLDAQVTASEFEPADGLERYQRTATGRVCNVVITVTARSDTAPPDDDLVVGVFTDQARRAQEVVTC